jgi:hypothetical protein
MSLRDLDLIRPVNGAAKRSAVRVDISRTSLLIGGVIGALVSALYFTLRGEPVALADEFVFGRQSRVGSIVTIPISGEHCRQAAFDNDSSAIAPLGDISCVLVIARVEAKSKDTREPDKFATISERFRK